MPQDGPMLLRRKGSRLSGRLSTDWTNRDVYCATKEEPANGKELEKPIKRGGGPFNSIKYV